MKFTVCPECREVILDGERCGSNKSCRACMMRRDRSDLLEIDVDCAAEDERSRVVPVQLDASVPIIQSLDALTLVSWAYWDYGTSGKLEDKRALVIESMGSKFLFVFGIIWLAISIPLMSALLFYKFINSTPDAPFWPYLLIPVIFWGLGAAFLFGGAVVYMTTTWIVVEHDFLGIERGIKRHYKSKWIKRTPETLVSMKCDGRLGNTLTYSVYLTNGEKCIVACDLLPKKADELATMLRTLLAAQL